MALAIICGFIGLVLALPVMMIGGGGMYLEDRNAFHKSVLIWMPVGGFLGGLTVGGLLFLSALAGYGQAQARYQRALNHQERENALRLERAKSLYASAYAEYLPKWQAWREKMRTYEAELASYQAWRAKFVAAWEAYHERAKQAVALFNRIHANVQMRGRVELELSDPEHIQSLFREAIAEVAKSNPDLGILTLARTTYRWKVFEPQKGPLTLDELRKIANEGTVPKGVTVLQHEAQAWLQEQWQKQPDEIVEYNVPALLDLCGDVRLEAVRDVLPSMPAIDKVAHESRQEPWRPPYPPAPSNMIFLNQDAEGYSAPAPPERVTWS